MDRTKCIAAIVSLIAAAMLSVGNSAAQTVPGSVQPEHLEQRFERPATPRRFLEPDIPEVAKPLAPDEARRIRFVLAGVVFEGITIYDQAVLAALYEKLLAKEISLADIYQVANALTAKYREDGYVLSRAFVPPQKVALGVVRIVVMEGYVERIVIRGEVEGRRGLIEAMANKITRSRPLNARVLERYSLLINDLPGLTTRAAIRRVDGATDGYELVLTFKQKLVDLFATANNRGDDFVGPYQFLLGANFNSVLGLYERTQIRLATTHQTEELRFADALHQQYLGSEGTRVTIEGGYTASAPGSTLADDDIDSRSVRGQISVFHPIVRTRKLSLFASGSFLYRNSTGDEAGVEFRDDRLRVVRTGLEITARDRWDGQNRITLTASQGMDILNASESGSASLSNEDGESVFSKFNLALARLQPLDDNWSILFATSGQKSVDPLLPSEEMIIGGSRFGRAFDPAEISGEDGVASSVEIRYTRTPNGKVARQYQLYTYFDAGSVWDFDSDNGGSRRETLMSAGLGFRIRFAEVVSLYVEGAQPVLHDVRGTGSSARNPRFFFGVTAKY